MFFYFKEKINIAEKPFITACILYNRITKLSYYHGRMTMTDSLQQQYTETVHASFHDSLTGLFNYGFFQLLLEREIKLSQRHGNIFTFVLVDIDDFSLVNKRLGTVRGDRLLKEIGSAIKESLREVDIAARYEDDTFAIILAETGECSLRHPLERLFARVAARIDQETTISAGLVVCPDDARSLQSIIYKAEQALQQAKLQGKNRYVIAGTGEPETKKEQPAILVVDDEPLNTKLLAATLATEEFQVITAHSGEDALEILAKKPIDLVLLDIMMPGMDGYEVCRLIKDGERTRMIPVVMVTALDDVEAKVRAINAGADDFLTKPPETVELLARVRSLVRVKTLNENLTSIENVLFSFANAVESKDHYTQGHINRVAELAERLGRRLHRPQMEMRSLRLGGALHDLGKIAINDEILNKNGPLDDEEWEIMRQHPIVGEKIARPLQHSLGLSLDIIRHHHEKLDGSGYPDGLQGDNISIPARIMSIVDIYDALTTDRPYRLAMPAEKALSILQQDAEQGKLDSHLVGEFIAMLKEQHQTTGNNQ